MDRQVVIDDASGDVLKAGYTDFSPELGRGQSILVSDFVFEPGLDRNSWRWDGSAFVDGGSKTRLSFLASSKLVADEAPITSTDWEDLGGVSTDLSFFCSDMTCLRGQALGNAKASGRGAELRIIERSRSGETVLSAPFSIAESPSFQPFEIGTNAAPATGQNTYVLQGRLGGASLASVQYVTLATFEVTQT